MLNHRIFICLMGVLLTLSTFAQSPRRPRPRATTGPSVVKGTFTDSRDGNVYETVKIGNQVWMASNLRYIPKKGDYKIHSKNPMDLKRRGVFYDSPYLICPTGWRTAKVKDYDKLFETLKITPWKNDNILQEQKRIRDYGQGSTYARKKRDLMKSYDWNKPALLQSREGKRILGMNKTGFSLFPSGVYLIDDQFDPMTTKLWVDDGGKYNRRMVFLVQFDKEDYSNPRYLVEKNTNAAYIPCRCVKSN